MKKKRTLRAALTVLTASTVVLTIGCSSDGGSSNTQRGTGGGPNGAPTEPIIPSAPASCPTLHQGDEYSINVQGKDVSVWVGAKQTDKKGPVFFYFHGTGGHESEAKASLGDIIKEITDQGGIVASFEKSTDGGETVDWGVWYDNDYKMTDDILACAVQQLNVDTHRIYAGGASAGGLAAATMVFTRSSYLAGAMPNSGGVIHRYKFQDPRHMGALMTAHGSFANDFVKIHFSVASMDADLDLVNQGGFAVDCDHGGGHVQIPAEVVAAQWTFLKAHPFGVSPEPYAAGLPANFPSICKIVQKPAPEHVPQIGCTKPADCPGQKCCYTFDTASASQYTDAKSSCGDTCTLIALCGSDADCAGATCLPTDYASYCGTRGQPIN
jgi:poly(3-hydroxybutyrate) depolymerase